MDHVDDDVYARVELPELTATVLAAIVAVPWS